MTFSVILFLMLGGTEQLSFAFDGRLVEPARASSDAKQSQPPVFIYSGREKEYQKDWMRKYRQTDKGKLSVKIYNNREDVVERRRIRMVLLRQAQPPRNFVYKGREKEYKKEWEKAEKGQTGKKRNQRSERAIAYNKEWRQSDEGKAYIMNYRELHRDYYLVKSGTRRAIEKSSSDGTITLDSWQELKKAYNYACAYCHQVKPLTMDHVQPLSRGGIHSISNIVPACLICNIKKHARTPEEWRMAQGGKIA